MALLFLLPCWEPRHCENPSQHCLPLWGAGGRVCRRTGVGVSRAFGSKGQACRENLISPYLRRDIPRDLQPNPGAEVGGEGAPKEHATLQRAKDSGKRILAWFGSFLNMASPHLGRAEIWSQVLLGRAQGTLGEGICEKKRIEVWGISSFCCSSSWFIGDGGRTF